jgi:hypothetical protein
MSKSNSSIDLSKSVENWYNTLNDEQKIELEQRSEVINRSYQYAVNLKWYGCIDIIAPNGSQWGCKPPHGYYVYAWKRLGGDVYYIGSGKNQRCYVNRKNDFREIIKYRDSIVYIIADGMTIRDARILESRIIHDFSKIGRLENQVYNLGVDKRPRNSIKVNWHKSDELMIKYNVNDILNRIQSHVGEERYILEEIQKLSDPHFTVIDYLFSQISLHSDGVAI